ncbi:MAG TPA: porin [Rhodoblastus sp.]|nr:porin [Rhodoblastus sp.]
MIHKKIHCAPLLIAAVVTVAQAGEASSVMAQDEAPSSSCFSNIGTYLDSPASRCPLSYAGLTFFGNVDAGYGYEQWGVPLGLNAKKPNYGIVKNSAGTHWLWSPNALSTSVLGVTLDEKLIHGWRLIGVAEGGFNPYTGRPINGPLSLADNNLKKIGQQTSNFDTSRNGQWDNSQAFFGLSHPTYGTLTYGRTNAFSHSLLSVYDPVASVAFSQLGFSGAYAGFGVNSTTRVNTALTYRLSHDNLRFAVQTQLGGYAQGNATTAQTQVQFGADSGDLSFDGVLHIAKNAAAYASYSGGAIPAGYNPNAILEATLSDTQGVQLMARYNYGRFRFYAGYIFVRMENPSDPHPYGFPTIAEGVFVPPGAVNSNAYVIPRLFQTAWTGLRYEVSNKVELASGVYWDNQNDYLPAPAVCKGTGSSTSSSKCAGGRYSYSILVNYKPLGRLELYAGVMVSTVYGGEASGYLHSQNIDPTVGVRFLF